MRELKWDYVYKNNTSDIFHMAVGGDHSASIEPHRHTFFEIGCVENGEVDHAYLPNGQPPLPHVLKQGDVFAVLPGMVHSYRNRKDFSLINILFEPDLEHLAFDELMALPGLRLLFGAEPRPLHLLLDAQPKFCGITHTLMHELYNRKTGYRRYSVALLTELLVMLGRAPEKDSQTIRDFSPPIWNAITFLNGCLTEHITLSAAAEKANMGKSQFCLRFKDETGMTPWQYLNRQRIEKAKFLLKTSNGRTIAEIAYLCGFNDNGYFARLFRRETGMTPNAYRCRGENDFII